MLDRTSGQHGVFLGNRIMKDISHYILEAGDRAVEEYMHISGRRENEDAIPEVFLTCVMALQLHKLLAVIVQIERDYKKLAEDLGYSLVPKNAEKLDRLRADIAIYENGRPSAIIEIKKFAESGRSSDLRNDLAKGDCINLKQQIDVYGAFLICETSQTMAQRRSLLRRKLRKPISFSKRHNSSAGGWTWCFGCARWGVRKPPMLHP